MAESPLIHDEEVHDLRVWFMIRRLGRLPSEIDVWPADIDEALAAYGRAEKRMSESAKKV